MNTSVRTAARLLLLLTFAGMAQVCLAAESSPAGTWNLSIGTPDGATLNLTLNLKKDGETYSGTLASDDGVESEITDVAMKDGELTFKISRDFSGQELKSTFVGKFDKDAYEGTVEYDLGGQTGELDVTGTRAGSGSPVGQWKLEIATPDGNTLQPTIDIKQDGDSLSGVMTGDDGSETTLEEVTFKDGALDFLFKADFGGQSLVSKFKTKIEGDSLTGTVEYDLGGQTGELDVTGTRVGAVANLSGTWLLVASSEAGTFEPKLHLQHEGDDISGKYEWIDGSVVEIDEAKLADGELTFKVKHDFDGQELVVSFKVKPEGEKLTGEAEYDLAGQTGTATIEGTKAKTASVAGTWTISITGENGETIEATTTLTQDGDTIGGDYTGPAGDAKISDAKLDGDQLSFTVDRERDGRKLVLKYKGKLEGDKLSGDVEFDFDGQSRTTQFTAERSK